MTISRGRTYSPFSRKDGRRFGISRSQFAALEQTIPKVDATAEQMRSSHPTLEVHYGDKETLEERRFPWLKKLRWR